MNNKSRTPLLQDVCLIDEGWLNKYLLTYLLPNGDIQTYESVSRKKFREYKAALGLEGKLENPDAICIVPHTLQDEIVLIKEFRYPLNNWCISLPAGLMEPTESIESCVARELKEETGYGLLSANGRPLIQPLPQFGYSSTGMTDETIQVVYAMVGKMGDPEPEPTEFIEVFTLPSADIASFLKENTLPIGTRCQLILQSYVISQHMQERED